MRTRSAFVGVTFGFVVWCAAAAHGAPTPEQKCQSSKNKAAGKYAACRQNAEAKLAATGDLTKYNEAIGKCETKVQTAWQKADQKAADASATCLDAPLTQSQFKTAIDDHCDNIATALGGGGLAAGPCSPRMLPASGQTTAYGSGSDGAVQAGSTLSYTDNGDGTITDNVTGLMWEKKDDSGGIHHMDNGYTWSGASYGTTNIMDGTIATTFLAALNAGGGFAGYTDWRIPNAKELQSIVDYEIPYPGPTVNVAFHKPATCTGCTDVTAATCSCTASAFTGRLLPTATSRTSRGASTSALGSSTLP
jgi:hypothetical protein